MAIAPITGALPALPTQATQVAGGAASPADSAGFKNMMSNAVDGLNTAQNTADNLAVQAATGQLTDVHDYMLAASQASLATELTVAVRNKAVDAFNEIMHMGI